MTGTAEPGKLPIGGVLAALGMVLVTTGTLLPWPVPTPVMPGTVYIRDSVLAPSAYYVDGTWLGLGGGLVALSVMPVLATVLKPQHYSGLVPFLAGGAVAVAAVLVLSHRGSAPGPWLALGGVVLQFAAVALTVVSREVRQ